VLANLMLDGIYPENMQQAVTDEEGVARALKAVYPVKGKVHFEGTPTPEAVVVFYLMDGKKLTRAADALVEADGSFAPTTYKAFDGTPAGQYAVTVSWREGGGPNRLPDRYASPTTSGLRAQVKPGGPNEFSFDLTRVARPGPETK
jgi:hypothetical protein